MATTALTRAALPSEPELRSFAHAAAHLLIERLPRASGARTVSRRAGVGLQHLDHRDYAPGDDVRHIDWRQTARRRRPILRRFEAEAVSDWTLLLDASSSMALPDAAKWRATRAAAAAMAYALAQLGHRVGVIAFGARVLAEVPRGKGLHHYALIARTLAALEPAARGERTEAGVCAPRLHGAASVFVISDGLTDDAMRRDLSLLLQRCNDLHLVQPRTASETRLPEAGEVELVDVETGERIAAITSAASEQRAAAERAAATARLAEFCARSGIVFTDWDISAPWQQMLVQHLVRARSSG